jgi:hypothetical protein
MATAFLSDQETKFQANPGQKVGPVDAGRVMAIPFTKTLPGSGLATGDTIALCRLPAGSRVLGGQFCWDQTQGATATTAIGISGTTGKYFAAAVTASAAAFALGTTQGTGYCGTALAAEEAVIATNAAAAWTASSVLRGHILVVGAS